MQGKYHMFIEDEFVENFTEFFVALEPTPQDACTSCEDAGFVMFTPTAREKVRRMFREFCEACMMRGINPRTENAQNIAYDCYATWRGGCEAFFGETINDLRDYRQSASDMAQAARQAFHRTPININSQGEIEI